MWPLNNLGIGQQQQTNQQGSQNTNIQNGIGQAQLGTSGIAASSIIGGGYTLPQSGLYYPWTSQGLVNPVPDNTEFRVRKVENGYILTRGGKEYVVTDEAHVKNFLDLVGIVL